MSSVPHFAVFIGTNGLFAQARLLLISYHDKKLTELGNIVVVIVTNPKFILPWVLEKFTVNRLP